jgi:hypothetical protein
MVLPVFFNGGAVAVRDSRWWTSNVFLYALLAVGLGAGLAAAVVDGSARPSFLWFVDGELIVCRTWGPFGEPLRETYRYARIESFEVASDIHVPDRSVVRIRFDQLDFNIPLQSDLVISDLPAYVEKLNRWLSQVKAGDSTARCWQIRPALVLDLLSLVVALPAWVLLFVLIALRSRRN